ncbi:MAG: ABC transporter [Chloroflexi bacterium HGW-Chloroflexi-10]|nr:MAG: ABC transporter [Chloroflexi bacterium HGW-Chloroflexi-10]
MSPGEVLGVVGQRGAGKTSLFELLSGSSTPTAGEIEVCGKRVTLHSAAQAQRLGIEAAQQSSQLADNLSVFQNVFLGRELSGPWQSRLMPREGEMIKAARDLLDVFNMPSNFVFEKISNLSNEQRQIVILARAMIRPSKLLLLDDPLAALSFERQKHLLEYIKHLSAQNISVIISSDDLKHIFTVTDHILVLYQGSQVAFSNTTESTPREIVELIVGSKRQEQVTPVIWAIENYHAAQKQAEELRNAQRSLRQSLQAQDSLNRQLIEKLRDQVEALDRLNQALQEANRRSMTEREAERKALARELHDQVIQDLLSYNYLLEEAENVAGEEEQRIELARIRDGIRQVVSSLRQICSDLRPPTIDNHGLSAAIRSLAHQWSDQNNIDIQLKIDPELGRLPETIELSVFRIIQEGLSNVRKHAKATQVKLTLLRTPTASLLVKMMDNGKGIIKPINLANLSDEKHFGLVGVSERVTLLGGTMKVSSPRDGGLELVIEIPSPYPSIESL